MRRKLNIKTVALIVILFCLLGCLLSCNRLMIPPAGSDFEKETPKKTENNNSQSADGSDLPDLTIEEIEEKLKPSVVKIICYDYDGTTEISQGSGFFIDDKGTFITNAHVIKNCYYMKITTYFGMTYDVDVMYVYNGTNSDYAICRASERQVSQPVEFVESANRFDKVYALGYPNGTFSINTTEGEIVSREAVEGSKHYYANTAAIDHGSSGGVLVDTKGRVLGITTGSFAEGGYVALKYQDFKDDVEKKHTVGKAPGKYFHDFDDYTFDSATMDKYFDIYVNVLSQEDGKISYEVGAKLKEKYSDATVVLDTEKTTTITVKIKTVYNYNTTEGDWTTNKVQSETDTVYLIFNSADELIQGKAMNVDNSIADLLVDNYYDLKITHNTSFGVLQTGRMSVYND